MKLMIRYVSSLSVVSEVKQSDDWVEGMIYDQHVFQGEAPYAKFAFWSISHNHWEGHMMKAQEGHISCDTWICNKVPCDDM